MLTPRHQGPNLERSSARQDGFLSPRGAGAPASFTQERNILNVPRTLKTSRLPTPIHARILVDRKDYCLGREMNLSSTWRMIQLRSVEKKMRNRTYLGFISMGEWTLRQ